MIWIVTTAIMVVAAVAALKVPNLGAIGAAGIVGLAVIFTGIRSVKIVKAGDVAVVRTFGNITGQRDEGLNLIAPWQSVNHESIRIQNARFDDISAFSAETQDVFATIEINYRVDVEAVQDLIRVVGVNWFDTLIDGRVQNFFKEETVKFETDEVAPNREVIRRRTQDRLSESLQPYSIVVTELLIVNVTFSPAYIQSIEDKQIATQQALKAEEEVAITKAEADKERERARGVRDATVIEAEGINEANELIRASLSPEVLQYLAITQFNDNVSIALIPSGDNLLIDPSSFLQISPERSVPAPVVPLTPEPSP